jgi:hypothetical protein
VRWFFNDRLSPWLLASVELEMREKQYYTALHLMLLGAEILSGFSAGRSPDVGTFCAFLERYVNRIMRASVRNPLSGRGIAGGALDGKKNLTLAEILWASFRCGFAEACAVYPGGSLAERSRYYYRSGRVIGVRLDIRSFHRDFVEGCRRYYADVYGDYLVRQKFIRRFDQLLRTGKEHRGRAEGNSGR